MTNLEINKAWIKNWAGKYQKTHLKERALEDEIFNDIKMCGLPLRSLTKEILRKIAKWKSGRVERHVNKNDEKFVKEVTKISLSTNDDKQLKIEVLTLLRGVGIRMASAILYFCFPKKYPIMDVRAWASLKKFKEIDGEIKDTFECWKRYTNICRKVAKQNGVSLRALDKALWQYNKNGNFK